MITFGLCSWARRGDLLHVDALVVAAHRVGDRLEPLARDVRRGAVGEVAAGGEVEAQEGVAGLHQGQEHALVGLRAGVRLHVGEAAAEQALGALDGEVLGDVHELAAAVVAPARIALGVLVGQHRALRLQHGAGDDVLRGDQLDLVLLAAEFLSTPPRRSRDRPRSAGPRRSCSRSACRRRYRRSWSASVLEGAMPGLSSACTGGRSSGIPTRAGPCRQAQAFWIGAKNNLPQVRCFAQVGCLALSARSGRVVLEVPRIARHQENNHGIKQERT